MMKVNRNHRVEQPLLEWTPVLMSTGYEREDQLIQWLIVCINIS